MAQEMSGISLYATVAAFLKRRAGREDLREALGADVYAPSPVGFTPDLVARLGALGFGVHLWTYNDERQMRRVAVMEGVSGIYTDFPQRLEPVLVELFGAKAGGG